jgi:hypothetical protein
MLALRARGFALRNAFADCLRGLVTAEEAQDYPTAAPAAEPVREPVVVRQPPQPSVVKLKASGSAVPDDPVGKARLAVSRATDISMLDALRTLVDKRHAEGVFTEAQRDELVDLMHHRAEMLIGDSGTEFEHEAASTEALS